MIILTIRSDKPEAEIGLHHDEKELMFIKWQAHRMLAETIHNKIDEVLTREGGALEVIDGIVAFKGPGSFTGLRIGISVANTLAYSLKIPIVGTTGKDWVLDGIAMLLDKQNQKLVMPEYGADVHITTPRTEK